VKDLALAREWGKKVCERLGLDPNTVERITIEAKPPYGFVYVHVDAYLTNEQADAILEDVPIEACEVTIEPVNVNEE
jgi:hypothetical protein